MHDRVYPAEIKTLEQALPVIERMARETRAGEEVRRLHCRLLDDIRRAIKAGRWMKGDWE